MHTEYFLLTADVTVQVPVTLIVSAQTCGKSRPAPVQNPSQVGRVDKVVDKSEVFRYSIFSTCAI